MREVRELFKSHLAKSHPLTTYSDGDIPLISNGLENNGFVRYVTPQPKDKVFKFTGLSVSAFCEATVQHPPFLARGNAGSGLAVLEPLVAMSDDILLWYAAYFNKAVRWRFSYGRMASITRLSRIKVPSPNEIVDLEIEIPAPTANTTTSATPNIHLTSMPITRLFVLKSGDYHKADDLPKGTIPLVSCGSGNNGILRYCTVPKYHIYQNTLTVAYNGQPLTTKYHPYQFAAKDDVAILLPVRPLKVTTILFIQMILNREQWRYSYGRKCYRDKLSRIRLYLPLKDDQIDEKNIADLMRNTQYWDYLCPMVHDSDTMVAEIYQPSFETSL